MMMKKMTKKMMATATVVAEAKAVMSEEGESMINAGGAKVERQRHRGK